MWHSLHYECVSIMFCDVVLWHIVFDLYQVCHEFKYQLFMWIFMVVWYFLLRLWLVVCCLQSFVDIKWREFTLKNKLHVLYRIICCRMFVDFDVTHFLKVISVILLAANFYLQAAFLHWLSILLNMSFLQQALYIEST